ncbi:hypothetical protein BGZ67_010766 [Mortierella alpina]|nr:hypothetical protein BGZ67_010766 [Mortierella alpina]
MDSSRERALNQVAVHSVFPTTPKTDQQANRTTEQARYGGRGCEDTHRNQDRKTQKEDNDAAVPASVDSDLFLHTTIARVLRKVGKDEINDVRWGLKLSELQCLVLGMVSRSDYAINIHNMGLKRNCKVIQLLVFPNDVVEYGLWLRNRQLAKSS